MLVDCWKGTNTQKVSGTDTEQRHRLRAALTNEVNNLKWQVVVFWDKIHSRYTFHTSSRKEQHAAPAEPFLSCIQGLGTTEIRWDVYIASG